MQPLRGKEGRGRRGQPRVREYATLGFGMQSLRGKEGTGMILEQLTLRNFCLFAGEQMFDPRPGRRNGRHLPIVLFGGSNGGGKTTLLDAIQLALYGVRARCSKRTQLSYDDFLRESIHHGAPA